MKFGAEGVVGLAGTLAGAYNKYRTNQKSKRASQASSSSGSDSADQAAQPSAFKRGGKVKKTGRAKVHKGEVVLTAKQARKTKRIKRGGAKR